MTDPSGAHPALPPQEPLEPRAPGGTNARPAPELPQRDTERSALRDEVKRLKPLAELGRMAATIAHEVRNPLAGISANAELLRESLTSADDKESVDIILAEVQRLGNLVTDLLYYSRERQAEPRELDLAWLARTTAELCQPEAEKLRVRVHCTGAGRAQGDPELSRQALLNVLRNGMQACRPGGNVHLRIATARIAVHDEGGGVPDSIRARLFEPFVTGRTRGLGLGATVAKRCQERQGGDLLLEQTGADGSVFVLSWKI